MAARWGDSRSPDTTVYGAATRCNRAGLCLCSTHQGICQQTQGEGAYLAQHVVLHLHPLVVSQQVVVLPCTLLPHCIREGLASEILACAEGAPQINSVVLHDLSSILHEWTEQGCLWKDLAVRTTYDLHAPSSP